MWSTRVVAAAALALAGCGGNSTRPAGPATLQEAVRDLDAGLVRIPHVNNSDLVSEEQGRRYEAARGFVRGKQCSAGSANPLILTSIPLNVRLTGNLAGDGKIEFSGAKAEGVGGSARLTSEQGVEVLLRISTLTDLPNEYLREMSALLQAKGLPDEVMQKLKKEVPGTYEALTARVGKLVKDFDPASCGSTAQETKRPARPQAKRPENPRQEASRPEGPRPARERSLSTLMLPTF